MNITNIQEPESSIFAQLTKVREQKAALLLMIDKALESSNIEEIQFNTGQSIIKTSYRSIADMEKAMADLERRENKIMMKLTGNQRRLITKGNHR